MDILRVIAVGTDRHVATARDGCQGGYPTSNIVASSIAPMSSYSSGIMTYPFVIFGLRHLRRHRPNFFSSASPSLCSLLPREYSALVRGPTAPVCSPKHVG